MTITRIIDGVERKVTVCAPADANGSERAEDWARRRTISSDERKNRVVREHILRYGRPSY